MNPMENTREAAEAAFQEQKAQAPNPEEMIATAQQRIGNYGEALQQVMDAGWEPMKVEVSVNEFNSGSVKAEAYTNDAKSNILYLQVYLDEQGCFLDSGPFSVIDPADSQRPPVRGIMRSDRPVPTPEEAAKAYYVNYPSGAAAGR